MEKEQLREKSNELIVKADGFEIINSDQANLAGDFLKELKKLEKEIKAYHKPMKQKVDEAKKEILAAEKIMLHPIEQATATIKTKLMTFSTEQEKIRRAREAELKRMAEEQALKEAIETGDDTIIEQVIVPVIEKPKMNFSTMTTWSAEVIDFAKLPDEYKLPDMSKLNKIAVALKEGFNIPGAKAVSNTSTRVGR